MREEELVGFTLLHYDIMMDVIYKFVDGYTGGPPSLVDLTTDIYKAPILKRICKWPKLMHFLGLELKAGDLLFNPSRFRFGVIYYLFADRSIMNKLKSDVYKKDYCYNPEHYHEGVICNNSHGGLTWLSYKWDINIDDYLRSHKLDIPRDKNIKVCFHRSDTIKVDKDGYRLRCYLKSAPHVLLFP